MISLCQDVTGDVRASMCSELPKIATVLGAETGKLLLNSIIDLANDEEDIVRGMVIEAIADMIVNFQPGKYTGLYQKFKIAGCNANNFISMYTRHFKLNIHK